MSDDKSYEAFKIVENSHQHLNYWYETLDECEICYNFKCDRCNDIKEKIKYHAEELEKKIDEYKINYGDYNFQKYSDTFRIYEEFEYLFRDYGKIKKAIRTD